MKAHVTISRLVKLYASTAALDEVSFEVEHGELTVLLGPSGSGKSTILKTIAGMISPTRGRVLLRDEDITDIPIHQRNIGLVMQGYSLFPHLTAYDNVAFPLRTSTHKCGERELEKRVSQMFDLTGLSGLERRRPAELSGGEQQRVALARALVFSPDVLLLDEPLAALDREIRERMQDEIRRIQKALGITVVYVTHDQTEAMKLADHIVVLNRGRVAQAGSPVDLYESPQNEFVARFLGSANLVHGVVTSIRSDVIHVRVGDSEVRVRCIDGIRPETHVTLMVRPERVRLGMPEADSNQLSATVVDSTYLGSALQTVLSLSDGTVWRSLTTPVGPRLEAGESAQLHWRMEDTRALPLRQPQDDARLEAMV